LVNVITTSMTDSHFKVSSKANEIALIYIEEFES